MFDVVAFEIIHMVEEIIGIFYIVGSIVTIIGINDLGEVLLLRHIDIGSLGHLRLGWGPVNYEARIFGEGFLLYLFLDRHLFLRRHIAWLIDYKLDIFLVMEVAVIDIIRFLHRNLLLFLIIFILIYLGNHRPGFDGVRISNRLVSWILGSDLLLGDEDLVDELGLPLLLSKSSKNPSQLSTFLHLLDLFALAWCLLKGKFGFLRI